MSHGSYSDLLLFSQGCFYGRFFSGLCCNATSIVGSCVAPTGVICLYMGFVGNHAVLFQNSELVFLYYGTIMSQVKLL